MSEPKEYNINDANDIKRLLIELSGYLSTTMPCRLDFLNDGTDTAGRAFAIQALDEIRRKHRSVEGYKLPTCVSDKM